MRFKSAEVESQDDEMVIKGILCELRSLREDNACRFGSSKQC